ncbi:cytochrome P450 3A19-like [Contarinia nasturtii]|uniref:cytochrome P450 3A19-like n=1 Tax=Contarinia nasturtii TaxID=265458 RepID=UPI0012D493C7|nr:cytochrome P450 3A19-like [Contarinia nasturtii]
MIRDGISADGLFTLKADDWKVHRRFVSPTINQPSVSMHLSVFNENIRKIVLSLSENSEYFDILPSITTCKLTMFVEAALGSEWEIEVKQRYLRQFIAIVSKRSLQLLFHIDAIWNLTKAAIQLKEYNQYGREIFRKTLEDKLKNGYDAETFLGRLLEVSNDNPQFSTEDVFAETATIITGATDTSSAASAFVALMLAMHPDQQEKVFKEIVTIMPDKNANLTQADLVKLEFTELCIKETLRLFPTAQLIGRVACETIKLSNNIEVPLNVTLVFCLRQIHIQEKYYGPTAHKFDPYRFLDKNFKNLPDAAYMPFSYGPRNCIGYHYAKVSVKCFIAHLIRNYRVSTTYTDLDQLQLVQNASLRLVHKHMIKVEPRTL